MCVVLFFALLMPVAAIDNGLGLTPPMGRRSWNLYQDRVNQSLLMSVMDGMVSKKRGMSLCDLGYCDVGLDDGWQHCWGDKHFPDPVHYYKMHDNSGVAMINQSKFPNFKSMTDYAHSIALTAGWYGNNYICNEENWTTAPMY